MIETLELNFENGTFCVLLNDTIYDGYFERENADIYITNIYNEDNREVDPGVVSEIEEHIIDQLAWNKRY